MSSFHTPSQPPASSSGTVATRGRWTSKRLRFACDVNPTRPRKAVSESAMVSFIPMDAVGQYGGLVLAQERPLEEIGNGYTYFEDGDVVVAKITPCFENGKGALAEGLASGAACGTTELHVMRSGSELDPRFLFYVSISSHFRQAGESEMYGAGGQKRIPESFIKNFRQGLPPLNEQALIVDFLDREVGRLDSIVAEKQKLLGLLEEKRLAIITHAVTKGLRLGVPTRDSGTPWLGRVPQHWQVRKLKYTVSHVVDCLHSTPHYDGDLAFPAIRTADLDRGRLLLNQARLVSEEVYRERIARLRPIAGDIMYSREGERFGFAALVPENVNLCLGQRMMMFRTLPIFDPAFLMWALNSEAIYQQVLLFSGGATSPHVNIGDIINFLVPLPPRGEQEAIVQHINSHCVEIDALSDKLRLGVARLTEYRMALVTNAVTGKIDVHATKQREAAA